MTIRERIEQLELATLSEHASFSARSQGRDYPIAPCTVRTEFMRDRDRIIHSKSFRRLKYKTQVFLQPEGDHYRTRLTHTLEVSQIARTISRALRLNDDLTEAIALGHDLGHTPFGHVGEAVLNEMLGHFEHNEQSLRVVELLENDGKGLNLTFEVRDGILKHKKGCKPLTLEGMAVNYSDRIAYINHDIDDAIRADVLKSEMLPESCISVLGRTHGDRINNMILDIIENSMDKPVLRMSERFEKATDELRTFMFANVYTNPVAKSEEGKARHVIQSLFEYYLDHPEKMSPEFLDVLESDGSERASADYIACMTDRFAVRRYEEIFVPRSWGEGK